MSGLVALGRNRHNAGVVVIRPATADDARFLADVLGLAADWRPERPARTGDEVLADPGAGHYVANWPRPGDVGVVAEDDGKPVGAAWWRFFPVDDPGYGFVDPAVPELSIAVAADRRGQGIGTRLLTALIAEAEQLGIEALSLSVETRNPAMRLYARLGFEPVGRNGGSITMVRSTKG